MFTKTKRLEKILVILFFAFAFSKIATAGTTGKIAGKILEASTGEPLIGANILLIGTHYGGAADIDGNYYILNIPPGVYSIKASSIGFSPKTIQNVRVSVDQTTRINIELGEETIEFQDVVISAERPIVRKDLTSTESKVSGDQIALLPLEDVQSVVNLQAGVVDGHFRG